MSRSLVGLLTSLALGLVAVPSAAQYEDWEAAEEDLEPHETTVPEGEDTSTGEASDSEEASERDGENSEEGTSLVDEALDDDGLADEGRTAIWVELAFFAGTNIQGTESADVFPVSPLLGAAYRVSHHIRVGAQYGLTLVPRSGYGMSLADSESGVSFASGNPMLLADYIGATESLRYRFGVGVTLPLADDDDLDKALAVRMALGMRGSWNAWLWDARRLSVIASGRLSSHAFDGKLLFGGDAALAILFHMGDEGTAFAVQAAGDAEYVLTDWLHAGVRLALVLYGALPKAGTSLADDNLQVSLMPYARMVFGSNFVTAGFLLNLDPPFGFSFDDDRVWGLRVGVGALF